MKRMKIHLPTDSPLELAESVANANASLRGGKQITSRQKPRKSSAHAKISEHAKPVKDPIQRAYVIASELTRAKSEFTIEDLRRVAAKLGKESPEDILSRLKERNLVYEVREGRYRAV